MTEQLTLRQWRQLRELTQEQLAERVGISAKTIYLYERHPKTFETASNRTVEKILKTLRIKKESIL